MVIYTYTTDNTHTYVIAAHKITPQHARTCIYTSQQNILTKCISLNLLRIDCCLQCGVILTIMYPVLHYISDDDSIERVRSTPRHLHSIIIVEFSHIYSVHWSGDWRKDDSNQQIITGFCTVLLQVYKYCKENSSISPPSGVVLFSNILYGPVPLTVVAATRQP